MQTFEHLMLTCLRFIRTALRILVSISAMGSVKLISFSLIFQRFFFLPACLFYAGYFAFVSQLSEAQPANLEFTIYGLGPAANLAAGIRPDAEFRFLLRFVYKGLC
jgi:hypothetical protein